MVIIMFPKKYEQNISRALDSVTNLLIRYFTGIVSESGIMTVLVTVGLLIFGFSWHDALIIAMFVGVLNVIPYLGPIIGIAIGIFIGVVGSTSDLSVFALMLRIAGTILFPRREWITLSCSRCSIRTGRRPIRSRFSSSS